MQIQCPHCSATRQLSTAKPGRYRLECRACGKQYLLAISSDQPHRVRVGVPRGDTQSGKTSPGSPTAGPRSPADLPTLDQTVDSSGKSRTTSQDSVAPPNVSSGAPVPPSIADVPVADVSALLKRDVEISGVSAGHEASEVPEDETAQSLPTRLGGYRIIRLLGRGAMGAVYQARQVSLDRDVALKTVRGRLADNPASLARFAREAYAAAQISHHNVVQIYDFGQEDGQHYFSMEWVKGGSLGDLVHKKGCVDPKLSASYILQAARGLQFAHRNGMVHRDVKPSNLLLGEDGVVKVADLGLVKVPDQGNDPIDAGPSPETAYGLSGGTEVTLQGTAVGTPAFMAPEQGIDASAVDHRADIYSLGCSLFYLLAGRSPFDAADVSEVMQLHAAAPLPDLAEINPRVPQKLIDVIDRSTAKNKNDRYRSVAEMIDDLQDFLGVESLTGFSPRRDQANRWETIVHKFNAAQWRSKLTGPLLIALATVALLTTLATPLISLRFPPAGPAMLLAACATAVVLAATQRRSAVADHLRGWVGSWSWLEVIVGGSTLLFASLVLMVSGLWIGALGGTLGGIVLGVAYHFTVTIPNWQAEEPSLHEAQGLLRDLRLHGADEDGIRDFFARYAGNDWQGIYEALFGYDELVEKRQRLASDSSYSGPTADRSVRDWLCSRLAEWTRINRESEDRKKLAELELNSLRSQGLTEAEARQQSWQMASAIMESAQAIQGPAVDEKTQAQAKRARMKMMLADARSGKYRQGRDKRAALKVAFSGYTRLIIGCMLLTIFAFAARASGIFNSEVIDGVRQGQFDLQTLGAGQTSDALGRTSSVWSIGIAGLLMCLSAFVSGWIMSPFAAAATLVILFGGDLGLPEIGPAQPWMVAALIGLVIYIPGIIYGESDRD